MDSVGGNGTKVAEGRRVSELMRDLMNVLRARFEDEFRDTGVTLPQLRLLKAVQHQQERSAASIARECHVTPQTLHTMLTRAVREGWITRGSSDRNHRFVTASLTPQGEALMQRGNALREQVETEMWQTVALESLRQTCETLESGLKNLTQPASPSKDRTSHPSR